VLGERRARGSARRAEALGCARGGRRGGARVGEGRPRHLLGGLLGIVLRKIIASARRPSSRGRGPRELASRRRHDVQSAIALTPMPEQREPPQWM
jgi:hypothetical protein